MRCILWIAAISLLLPACQVDSLSTIAILYGEQTHRIQAKGSTPAELLDQADLSPSSADRVLVNGVPSSLEQPLLPGPHVLQVLPARQVTLSTPEGEQAMQTSAQTVGEFLRETGYQLYAADFLDPPASAPVLPGMSITYRPSQELSVTTLGGRLRIRSSMQTIGQALAEAGIPLQGQDYSLPAESEALPPDGQIQVVHVSEALVLALKTIPFEVESSPSAEIALGEQQVVQPGIDGLAVARTRIRYENGQEISRISEEESLVRPPQNRIVNTGTKIVVKTAVVDGVTIEYWRALEMYATVYSPCNSGIDGCSYGTASGMPAGKGVVAMDPDMFNFLQGQRIYVPGYGFAVVGDVGGGYLVEEAIGVSRYRWIDLGFDDDNLVDMSGWQTVYFLAPAPASIPLIMQ